MTTTERLKKALSDRGYTDISLSYPRGSWKRADVARWHGYMTRPDGAMISIICWYPMTDCLRRGFTLEPNTASGESGGALEAIPLPPPAAAGPVS